MKNRFFKSIRAYGLNSVIVLSAFKNFMVLLLLLLIPGVLLCRMYFYSIEDKLVSGNKSEAMRIAALFENIFRDTEYLAAGILSDQTIRNFLSTEKERSLPEDFEEDVKRTVSAYSKGEMSVRNIYLYSEKKDLLFGREGVADELPLADSWREECRKEFQEGYRILPIWSENQTIISWVFMKKNQGIKGCVVIEMDRLYLKKKVDSLLPVSTELFVLQNQEMFYKTTYEVPDQMNERTYENPKLSDKKIFYSLKSSKYDFEYIVCTENKTYREEIRWFFVAVVCIGICVLSIALLVAILLSVDNLGYMTSFMDVLDGKRRYEPAKENETEYIAARILQVMDDNSRLKEEVEKRILDFDEIKRKTLQAQINPHFINNSLNLIIYQLLEEKGYDTGAAEMIAGLSKMVHYCYITEKQLVPLREEIEFTRMYLAFLELRYGNFKGEIEVKDNLEEKRICKLCVQPFVENAVVHGIRNRENGILKITCFREGKFIHIRVYDNGYGMTGEKVKEITDRFDRENFEEKNIGIYNVYKRMQLIYGKEAGISIESREKEYTSVTLIIPERGEVQK